MNKIGVYPGTFDPLTFGHMDLIKRSLKIVDNLIIAVANNNNKIPLLTINERIDIITEDLRGEFSNYDHISVTAINGLLTNFAQLNL